MKYNLPTNYDALKTHQRREVREQYIAQQQGRCWYCDKKLGGDPRSDVQNAFIIWDLFPPGFRKHPVHLQHDHETGMTQGAVHMKCNAYLWQYHDL